MTEPTPEPSTDTTADTVETKVFDTDDLPEAVDRLWCEWLRRHGVRPDDVVLPGWITRDPAAGEIRHGAWLGAEGAKTVREVIHHLDGPVEPFPDEATALRQQPAEPRGSDVDTRRHFKQQARAEIQAGKAKLAERETARATDSARSGATTAAEAAAAIRRADELLAATDALGCGRGCPDGECYHDEPHYLEAAGVCSGCGSGDGACYCNEP